MRGHLLHQIGSLRTEQCSGRGQRRGWGCAEAIGLVAEGVEVVDPCVRRVLLCRCLQRLPESVHLHLPRERKEIRSNPRPSKMTKSALPPVTINLVLTLPHPHPHTFMKSL